MMTLLVSGFSLVIGLGALIVLLLFIMLLIKWVWEEIFY